MRSPSDSASSSTQLSSGSGLLLDTDASAFPAPKARSACCIVNSMRSLSGAGEPDVLVGFPAAAGMVSGVVMIGSDDRVAGGLLQATFPRFGQRLSIWLI